MGARGTRGDLYRNSCGECSADSCRYLLLPMRLPSPLASSPVLFPEAATLLVLLPLPYEEPAHRAATEAWPRGLRARLGPAIRVLKLDEASHPAVVRSFGTPALPAYVLVRHGVELWRQSGLPEEETFAALLLRKVAEDD